VHVAERELETWLVLDASPSMEFGTADRTKADVAEGAALVMGRLAGRRGNRLGLAVARESVLLRPPRQGRPGQMQLLHALRAQPCPDGSPVASLADALSACERTSSRRGLIVVVSDFLGSEEWTVPLGRLAARHAVLAVEVRDPRESDLPAVGYVPFACPETRAQLLVDTSDRRVREAFSSAAAEQRRRIARAIRRTGALHVGLSTAGPWLRTLGAALHRTAGAAIAGGRP
jgi:uncharacterized protein (DUF58 family)